MSQPIGLCTWIYGHQDHLRIAQDAAALGCDGVELFVDIHKQPAARMRDLYGGNNLRLFSLTPVNVDLCHLQAERRQQAIDYYTRLLDYAVAVGCEAITCHEYVGRGRPHDTPTEERQRLVASMRLLAMEAEQRRIDLLLEPLRPPLVSQIHTISAAVALCQQVGSARLKLVLDTFHLEASETDPVAAIANSKGHLGAMQLADRQRQGLGRGGMDLSGYLQAFGAIGFRGPWILECTSGLNAPSLDPKPVDLGLLHEHLATSVSLLRQKLSL